MHSTAQTAHQGDVTERPPVREPNGKCVARQPFSWLCNYPHREVKSLQQLRCSVGKAIDRRSKHVCPARALSSSRVVQKSDAKEGRVKGMAFTHECHFPMKTCECEEHTKRRWWVSGGGTCVWPLACRPEGSANSGGVCVLSSLSVSPHGL